MIGTRARHPRPWLMLSFGVLAQASSTVVVSMPAFLIPLLHTERGEPRFEPRRESRERGDVG